MKCNPQNDLALVGTRLVHGQLPCTILHELIILNSIHQRLQAGTRVMFHNDANEVKHGTVRSTIVVDVSNTIECQFMLTCHTAHTICIGGHRRQSRPAYPNCVSPCAKFIMAYHKQCFAVSASFTGWVSSNRFASMKSRLPDCMIL